MKKISNFLSYITRIPEIIYRIRISRKLNSKELIDVKKPLHIIGYDYIKIGHNFAASYDVRIEAYDNRNGDTFDPSISFGDNVYLNSRTHIGSINKIEIGDGFLAGADVMIIDHDHGNAKDINSLKIKPGDRKLYSKGPIIIGNNVWVGEKATILGGVTIGDGVVIGANTVITKNIPSYSVAVGNPARIIKRNKHK